MSNDLATEPGRLIFLDFDGVIRTPSWNGECIANLNWLTSHTDAKIIVSSDWRYSHSWVELKKVLSSVGVTGDISGVTSCNLIAAAFCSSPSLRASEILSWVGNMRYLANSELKSYVIIDDLTLPESAVGISGRFLRTSYNSGLTFELARTAWSILVQRPENEAPAK